MTRFLMSALLLGLSGVLGCESPKPASPQNDAAAVDGSHGAAATANEAPTETVGQSVEVELLVPDSEPIPDLDTEEKRKGKGIPTSAMVLDLGGTVRSYAAEFPFAVVAEQGEPVVQLGQDGFNLWVSARFFDEAGKLVAEIEKNKLVTSDHGAYEVEQTPHSLTVINTQAKEEEAKKALVVHYLNDHAVRLFSDFYSPKGVHVVINEDGVLFGHGRSLSNTGLNGTAVVLDPPADALARASKSAGPPDGSEDSPSPAGDDVASGADSGGNIGEAMTKAAGAFLASLSPDELAKARMKFDDPARLDWTNIPKKERKGLPISEMSPEKKKLCHALLRAALSSTGYAKAARIMSLENNLREGEKNLNTGWARNPGHYYLTVFGEPAATGSWGWSFEGHHLSLNFVVRDGEVTSETPSFWGANPATVHVFVPGGPEPETRTLAAEEQLAFDLVNELSEVQRVRAMIAEAAPAEYRAVGTPQPPQTAPEGLPAAEMNEVEKQTLRSLLETYASHLAPQLAAAQLADIDAQGFDRVYFAWAGATTPGKGHYYRIQGPSFLLELVNIQSDPQGNLANHIHSVWRNLAGDFGVPAN
jgi:hypothetical protein